MINSPTESGINNQLEDYNILNNKLEIFLLIFNHLINILNDINNLNYENTINIILLFILNNNFYLNKLINVLKKFINTKKDQKNNFLNKINSIEKTLNNNNLNVLELYNNTINTTINNNSINNNNANNNTNSHIQFKKINFNTNIKPQNLDVYSIDNLDNNINYDKFGDNTSFDFSFDENYIGFKSINIGFDNFYSLHIFKYLKSTLPFNLLLYIEELDQVVIKIGNKYKFEYINSKLCKVYNLYDSSGLTSNDYKTNSILCNNNIKSLDKRCFSDNCKYYHDYIIGYYDNAHKNRYFSSNPIVYNCPTFKDGSKISINKKKIDWHNAINLYQSSLSNILIACVHSQE
jgi:hypothetical protein